MKIAFAYNLKPKVLEMDNPEAEFSAEFDTPETAESIGAAIAANGHEVMMVECNPDSYQLLKDNKKNIDFMFNFSESVGGGADRRAQMPVIAEILHIPYLGPTPMGAATILSKARSKMVWKYCGVQTADFQVFLTGEEKLNEGLKFPLLAKPVAEGSSMGIRSDSIVNNEEQLRKKVRELIADFKQAALAETFLPGRDFTISLLGNGRDLINLPIIEYNYDGLPEGVAKIDGYEAKWLEGNPANKVEENSNCPAKLEPELEAKMIDLAKRAFWAVECRDWGRVDMRLDENGVPNVLEINSPCGLNPIPEVHSSMPTAAKAAGMSFEQLLGKITEIGLKRYGLIG